MTETHAKAVGWPTDEDVERAEDVLLKGGWTIKRAINGPSPVLRAALLTAITPEAVELMAAARAYQAEADAPYDFDQNFTKIRAAEERLTLAVKAFAATPA